MKSLSLKKKLKSLFYVTLSGITGYATISIFKQDEKFYRNYIMPTLHLLDAEKVHKFGVFALKYHLIPKSSYIDPQILKMRLFGKELSNPIGIAAGFDKDAEAVLGLKNIGFGFIEVGSVTPLPQDGNDKPRVFRLKNDHAIINRYGFNNEGHNAVIDRIKKVRESNFDGILGVNLGKNKTSLDPIRDYVIGVHRFAPLADYLVINISSPNTPGLRSMQGKQLLTELLTVVLAARNELPEPQRPPLLLKLAPDLSADEKKDIAAVISLKSCKIDGLIVSNTTIARPESLFHRKIGEEMGGLSGKPLRDASTRMIGEMYRLTGGKVPIIGVGGVFSGSDAYDKIKAGASAVQIYTGMVYEGPPIVTKIKRELKELLVNDGFKSVEEAVGKDFK